MTNKVQSFLRLSLFSVFVATAIFIIALGSVQAGPKGKQTASPEVYAALDPVQNNSAPTTEGLNTKPVPPPVSPAQDKTASEDQNSDLEELSSDNGNATSDALSASEDSAKAEPAQPAPAVQAPAAQAPVTVVKEKKLAASSTFTNSLELRIQTLEKELSDLKAARIKAGLAEEPKKMTQQLYDPVPKDQVGSITGRIKLVEMLVSKYGRAYDYRGLTTPELKKILGDLEKSAHSRR